MRDRLGDLSDTHIQKYLLLLKRLASLISLISIALRVKLKLLNVADGQGSVCPRPPWPLSSSLQGMCSPHAGKWPLSSDTLLLLPCSLFALTCYPIGKKANPHLLGADLRISSSGSFPGPLVQLYI